MCMNHYTFASLLAEPSVRILLRKAREEGCVSGKDLDSLPDRIREDSELRQELARLLSFFEPRLRVMPPAEEKRRKKSDHQDFGPDANLSRYLRDIYEIPRLSEEEERELYAQLAISTDPEEIARLRQKMISANLRFVVYTARQYQNRGIPLLELIEVGNTGIITAAERFDPRQGFKFISYAVWWIRQAIQEAFKFRHNYVRIPVHQIEAIYRFNVTQKRLEQSLQRLPTDEELAKTLGISVDEVVKRQELIHSQQIIYLQQSVKDDEDFQIADFIADPHSPESMREAEHQYIGDMVRKVVDRLPPREASVLRVRFGLLTGKPETLEDTAEILGEKFRKSGGWGYGEGTLTRERIRQVEERALQRCRKIWQHIHGESAFAPPVYTPIQDLFHEFQKEVV